MRIEIIKTEKNLNILKIRKGSFSNPCPVLFTNFIVLLCISSIPLYGSMIFPSLSQAIAFIVISLLERSSFMVFPWNNEISITPVTFEMTNFDAIATLQESLCAGDRCNWL